MEADYEEFAFQAGLEKKDLIELISQEDIAQIASLKTSSEKFASLKTDLIELVSLKTDPEKLASLKTSSEKFADLAELSSLEEQPDLEELATTESDLRKACILAATIANVRSQIHAFQTILSRSELSLEKALEIARSLSEQIRSKVLKSIAFRPELSLEEALIIADSISNPNIRDKTKDIVRSNFAIQPGGPPEKRFKHL